MHHLCRILVLYRMSINLMLILVLLYQILNQLPFLPVHMLKNLILVNGRVRRRQKGRLRRRTLRRRSSLQPLTFMLESHQPLVIMLGVSMYLFSESVKLSSIVYFARVITFSRTVPVFPLCPKCGLNILCHQSLIIMLMMPRQPVTLWLRVKNERSDILAYYVRICIVLTFSLA